MTIKLRLLCLACGLPLLLMALSLLHVAGRYAIVESNAARFDGVKALRGSRAVQVTLSRSLTLAPELLSPNIGLYELARVSADDRQATSHLLDVLNLRVSWPYDWMSLAELYGQQAIFDERMTTALHSVIRYGASERSLVYRKALFAVRYWYGFDVEQRSIVEPAILVVLNQKKLAYQFFFDLERYQRSELFCRRYASQYKYGQAWCVAFDERRGSRGAG